MLCHRPPAIPTLELTRSAASEPQRLAVYRPNRWTDRRTVRVRFLDGEPSVWQRVVDVMEGPEGWSAACGFRFVFDQDAEDAEIRITLTRGGSWSYLGNYCLGVPRDRPTMQFGWLDADTNPVEVRRVVLHEFGHALGFIHEHSTPWAGIPWDYPAVYAYYRRTNGWDEMTTRAQVLEPYAEEMVEGSAYDTDSIMSYCIPAEMTLDHVRRGCNTTLSQTDRIMAAVWYGEPDVRWRRTHLGTVVNRHTLGGG